MATIRKKKAKKKRALSQKQMASLGGLARAKNCTARQRSLSARKAALARWHKPKKRGAEDWAR